jgi:hypothetical protein
MAMTSKESIIITSLALSFKGMTSRCGKIQFNNYTTPFTGKQVSMSAAQKFALLRAMQQDKCPVIPVTPLQLILKQ